MRQEAARADGIVLVNTGLDDLRFDDQAKQAAVMGQLEFMRDAAQEIENFGPNAAIAGGDVGKGSSGRAIALLQQAGIAELGPYMTNLRSWKIRVYRALFNAAQSYWINERWIRVTDAQGEPQFVQINATVPGPDGMPQKQNAIGELDVDIILDEGPDTVTLMQDTYDAISQALPAVAPMLSPTKSAAVMDVLDRDIAAPGRREEAFPRRRRAGADAARPEAGGSAGQAADWSSRAARQAGAGEGKGHRRRDAQAAGGAARCADRKGKGAMEMEIEREKAQNQIQIEMFKAEQTAQLKQREAADAAMAQRR